MKQTIKLFFVSSLLLNLLLAGVILGHAWWHVSDHWQNITTKLEKGLSPEKQQIFEAAMQHMKEDTDTMCKQIIQSRDRVAGLLAAEPFDPSAYQAQVHDIQKMRTQISEQRNRVIVDLATQFDAKERSTLVNLIYTLRPASCQSGRPQ
jgi:uncharacterized membrane protein